MTTMSAAIFYWSSPPDEISHLLNGIWKEEDVRHMIYVKHVSSRGNSYIRGLIVSADDVIPLPPEFEIRHLPEEHIEFSLEAFRDEIAHERNGIECS